MNTKPYHHGDLRRSLIETGLELIHEEGVEKLSLRKAAARCGISNAAVQMFRKVNLPEKKIENKIIAIWALVQGLSSISAMPNVVLDDNWEARTEDIIKSI